MIKKILILWSFFCLSGYSQQSTTYIFNVELDDYTQAPVFIENNGVLLYNGVNVDENSFFSNYIILDFYQTYPSSRRIKTLNMFTFVTSSSDLMTDLLTEFSAKYLRAEDLTNQTVELTYYPNDYGITDPNNGSYFANQKNLDYINAPKAWDFTTGDSLISVGISDAKIENLDLDFVNKITFLQDYIDTAPYFTGGELVHGTGVTGIATGRGNNNHAGTGICMDCDIIATSYRRNNYNPNYPSGANYDGLLQLAQHGVKVINMSWRVTSNSPETLHQSEQDIIDEIHVDYNVVLVAGAGNENALYYPNDELYGFPASYNNVISVSAVNHFYELYESYGIDASETNPLYSGYAMSYYVEDMFAPRIIPNKDNSGLNVPMIHRSYEPLQNNNKVDICAPGYSIMLYNKLIQGINQAGSGTSQSAPHVTGTVGLMYSVYNCLINDEAEDILQLTSKSIEFLNGNQPFIGRIGSGKLETGDAVEFTSEMISPTGNAIIDGQDFYRFNFDLQHINNKLTISNQTFRDDNVSNFEAKTEIRLLPNTRISPNSNGSCHLSIDPAITLTTSCPPPAPRLKDPRVKNAEKSRKLLLYPNPNNGSFTVSNINYTLLLNSPEVNVSVYDIHGRNLYEKAIARSKDDFIEVAINNLSPGVYFVKLASNSYSEEIKFIKN